ncbi:hypothetical protein D5038_11800 [Verminephrobacter aporrectodeae subsp. tuberculatae]|nr:hypothetical protein [Verminephrobacter aporrectodeae subsp. tuberculatae]
MQQRTPRALFTGIEVQTPTTARPHGRKTMPDNTTIPTIDVSGCSIDPPTVGIGQPAIVTVKFSEPVKGLVPGNLDSALKDNKEKPVTDAKAVEPDANGFSDTWKFTIAAQNSKPPWDNSVLDMNTTDVVNKADHKMDTTKVSLGVTYKVDLDRPTVSSATVNGDKLVLTWNEALLPDDKTPLTKTPFSVSVDDKKQDIADGGVVVDSTRKTVTLTLSTPVFQQQVVKVTYTDLTANDDKTGVIQDLAGNDAISFPKMPVTNNTPDIKAPVLITSPKPTVNGNTLVLHYSDEDSVRLHEDTPTGNGGFTVSSDTKKESIPVNSVTVNAADKTVTLTLSRPADYLETVTVSYTAPGDHMVRDAADHGAANFTSQSVDNITKDTTPPTLITGDGHGPKVTGDQLTLSYEDQSHLNGIDLRDGAGFTVATKDPTAITVSKAVVNPADKTVTLTLSRTVADTETLTVSYTKPTGNDAAVVQDVATNPAANFTDKPVTVEKDTSPPSLITEGVYAPTVNGKQLVLTYTDANLLDGQHIAPASAFAVNSSANDAITVSKVTVTGRTVTLELDREVAGGEVLGLSYNQPATDDRIQDTGSHDAPGFANQAVTNKITDTTPPVFESATVNGSTLTLSYTDAGYLNAERPAPASAFGVSSDSHADVHVSKVSIMDRTVTLTLDREVASGEVVKLTYTAPADTDPLAIQDASSNHAISLASTDVKNFTPAPHPNVPGTDSDGVPVSQEDQAVGPTGAVTGDGNGDGIADSLQAAVGSISVTTTNAETSSDSSTSLTLVADSQDGDVSANSKASITSLEQKATPPDLPQALETPIELTSFQATLETTGSSESFSLFVDPATQSNGYWMQDSTGTWVNLTSEPYGGKMVAEGERLRLDFSITDGGQFDADGKADGVITAPGAAGHMPLSIVGQAPDLAQDGFWF